MGPLIFIQSRPRISTTSTSFTSRVLRGKGVLPHSRSHFYDRTASEQGFLLRRDYTPRLISHTRGKDKDQLSDSPKGRFCQVLFRSLGRIARRSATILTALCYPRHTYLHPRGRRGSRDRDTSWWRVWRHERDRRAYSHGYNPDRDGQCEAARPSNKEYRVA